MDNGGFYITAKISFNSLKELVQHHSRACSLWEDEGGVTEYDVQGLHLSLLSLLSRRCRWAVHEADEAVSVEGTAEALVAG